VVDAAKFRSPLWVAGLALLMGVVAWCVYLDPGHYAETHDSVPNMLLPISILEEGNLYFDQFFKPDQEMPYFFARQNGHVVSFYPIVPGLLNVPAYWFAKRWLGWEWESNLTRLSKWTSATVAALSVTFMFLTLTAICTRLGNAVLLTALYAFATCCWSVAAQSLWQHGPSLLFLTAALALLVRPQSPWLPLAGFFLGMAVWNRPTNILFAAPVTLWLVVHHRDRRLIAFLLFAAIPAVLMAWYSCVYWGTPFAFGQGHRQTGVHGLHQTGFTGPFLPNLAGLLVSPARGLFVFSPIFLFSVPALAWSIRAGKPTTLCRYLAGGALLYLGLSALWTVWWGGHSFGYRLLIETVPVLVVGLAIAWEKLVCRHWWLQAVFWPAVIVSIYLHFLGARYYPSGWNMDSGRDVDQHTERLWDWRDTEWQRLHHRFLAGERPPEKRY